MSQSKICQECKAFLSDREMKYHPYEYCILAKSFPNNWRDWILRFKKAFDNDPNLSNSSSAKAKSFNKDIMCNFCLRKNLKEGGKNE